MAYKGEKINELPIGKDVTKLLGTNEDGTVKQMLLEDLPGGNDGMLMVNVRHGIDPSGTYMETDWYADKTYDEIMAAYNSGKTVNVNLRPEHDGTFRLTVNHLQKEVSDSGMENVLVATGTYRDAIGQFIDSGCGIGYAQVCFFKATLPEEGIYDANICVADYRYDLTGEIPLPRDGDPPRNLAEAIKMNTVLNVRLTESIDSEGYSSDVNSSTVLNAFNAGRRVVVKVALHANVTFFITLDTYEKYGSNYELRGSIVFSQDTPNDIYGNAKAIIIATVGIGRSEGEDYAYAYENYANIGDIDDLTTTQKDDLVNAINSLTARVAALEGGET